GAEPPSANRLHGFEHGDVDRGRMAVSVDSVARSGVPVSRCVAAARSGARTHAGTAAHPDGELPVGPALLARRSGPRQYSLWNCRVPQPARRVRNADLPLDAMAVEAGPAALRHLLRDHLSR